MILMIFSVRPEVSSCDLRLSFSSETATMDVSTKRRMLISLSRMVCAKLTICSSVKACWFSMSCCDSAVLLIKALKTSSCERSRRARLMPSDKEVTDKANKLIKITAVKTMLPRAKTRWKRPGILKYRRSPLCSMMSLTSW